MGVKVIVKPHEPDGASTKPRLHGVAPLGVTTNEARVLEILLLIVTEIVELLVMTPASTLATESATLPCKKLLVGVIVVTGAAPEPLAPTVAVNIGVIKAAAVYEKV